MQFQLDQFRRLFFGAKRERYIREEDENQLALPFHVPETKQQEPEQEPETEDISYSRKKKR